MMRQSAMFRAGQLAWLRSFSPWLLSLLWISPAAGQSGVPVQTTAAPQTATNGSPELTTSRDEAATFKVNVKLVLVHVLVRDAQGKTVGNLKQEDFNLLDDGKPQVISQFSSEKAGRRLAPEPQAPGGQPAEAGPNAVSTSTVPSRYIAYLFDDVHLQFPDLARARDAAEHNLATLQPGDRVAVLSTSGQTVLDFSDDRDKLQQALLHLQPRPIGNTGFTECPAINYYMADKIENQHDTQLLQVVTADVLACQFQGNPRFVSAAQTTAENTARERLRDGDRESRLVLTVLKDTIRRISLLPGQRSVVVISPGFLTPQMQQDVAELEDLALHSQIILNALDARGLYTIVPGAETSDLSGGDPAIRVLTEQYQTESATEEGLVLADFADATGGSFFHNRNDLEEGFRQLATAPEYFYVLGFAPQNLKLDGRFHNLKVTLKQPQKLSIQARRGYFAPRHAADPSEEAKQEIEEAVFSQDEVHGLPVELHTQFFKSSEDSAKLSVLAHVDVKRLHFRKVDGRNRDDLTVVSALFDRNGNYVVGNSKILEMRLRDQTLESRLQSGITLKTSFDVKPGSYLVRLVVRDAEGQQISAESGAVEIP